LWLTAPAGALKIVRISKTAFPIYRCDPRRGGGQTLAIKWTRSGAKRPLNGRELREQSAA